MELLFSEHNAPRGFPGEMWPSTRKNGEKVLPVITLVFKFVLKLGQPIKSDTLLFPPSLPVFGKHVLLIHTFIVKSEFCKDS